MHAFCVGRTIPLRLEIRDAAAAEADEAYAWYAQRSVEAAQRFIDELDEGFRAIVEAPARWPRYSGRTRRYLLRRFPHMIIYRVTDDAVIVFAIMHGSRRPDYWRHRR